MVADWVRVTSRSYKPRAKAVSWYATGEDNFQVSPAEMNERGTKIEIKLKEDAAEFAEEYRLKNIIHKHSDYIGFPIYVGDDEKQVNKQTSLWRTSKADVTEEQYKDFYRQVTLDFEDPLLHIHTITDAPVQLYALLYIPGKGERGVLSLRKDDGLKLYSRNILIDEYNKDLLPEYLRFVQGVVDSEDLPLNVSRETVQSVGLMPRLKKVVTGQVMKELENLAKNNAEKYKTFWQEFGVYLKQGIAANPAEADSIQPLLRFKTNSASRNLVIAGRLCWAHERWNKRKFTTSSAKTRNLFCAARTWITSSRKGTEVLLLTDPMDSFMLMGLHKYKDFELKNVAQAEVDTPEKPEEKTEAEKIPDDDFNSLVERFKKVLGERVTDVRASKRLSQSVARLADPDGSLTRNCSAFINILARNMKFPRKSWS